MMFAAPTVVALFLAAGADFDVVDYDVALTIDRAAETVEGRERIRLRATRDGVRALSFPRNGIEVRGADLPYTDDGATVTLRPPKTLRRDRELSFTVTFTARKPKGIVFHPDAVYTVFDTCTWMLCRDRPGDKATFTLSVAAPPGLSLVASGQPTGPRAWREEVASSPYLFAFALGPFARTTREHAGVTFEYDVAGRDEAWVKRAFADDDRMLDFFVEKAGRPLPRAFYRQVVVGGGAAQEASSFSILGSETLDERLTHPEEDWLVAHELAHQFWGNLVTCAEWKDFWLNEGLTTFMVGAYKERRWGRAAYEHERELWRKRHQAAIDAKLDVPLTFAGEYPSLRMKRAITYQKAALFLDRLRETMGERAFWAALAAYTQRFAGRSVTSADFQRAFAEATDVDLAPLFAAWVY